MDRKGGPSRKQGAVGRLLDFAGPRKALTYLGCALSAASMIVGFGPYVCIWLVARDLIAVAPDWSAATSIAAYGWWALGFSVASILLYFAGLMCTHLAAFRCASNMRKRATEHLMRTSLGYFDTHASGALRRVVDGCAAETEGLLAHKLPDTAGSVAMIAGMLVLFFAFDWRLGLACLAPVVLSLCCMFYMMGGRGMDFMTKYMESLVKMNETGTEYVRGIPVVKVFQQTVHSFRAFHAAIVDYRDMATNYVNFCRLPQVVQLTAINGTFVVLVPAAILLAAGAGDFGRFLTDFLFYVIFSAFTTTVMSKVMYSSEALMMAEDSMRRVNEILAVAPMEEVAEGAAAHPAGTEVALENVTFAYPGSARPALRDVSLTVPAGATVALVGPSGGGKSTLASLVPRFWDPQEGVVAVGGADVRRIPAAELMDTVAFVFQNDRLFKGTLADNIRMGRPDASDEDVAAAARAAQCDDIIAKFPEGLATRVGADGVYLSGGECQRIALARAILKDAPVVVLDEATAFADPENEALIQQALGRLAAGKTVLMIAHRLSTVVDADLIAVVDDGAIVERGTHDELLARGGTYARLWKNYCQAAQWKIAGGSAHAA